MSLAMWVGAFGLAEGMTRPLVQLPFKLVLNYVGAVDGFGFGRDVVPIGGDLPGAPTGSGDPAPFDAPDEPCAPERTWTHDFTADLPTGASILFAVLIVNIAGVQPGIFPSFLSADDTAVLPLTLLPGEQGEFGSGPIVVPLNVDDLADGLLKVTITKGITIGQFTVCDDQFYDASLLVVVIKNAP
jgi:hypothetical protein